MKEETGEEFTIIETTKNGKALVGQVNLFYENFKEKTTYPFFLYLKVPLTKNEISEKGLPNTPEISQTCYDVKDKLIKQIKDLSIAHFVTHYFCDAAFHVYMYMNTKEDVNAYLNQIAYQPKKIRDFSFEITEDLEWEHLNFIFNKNKNLDDAPELKSHLERNIGVWKSWKQHGITEETELTVLFHFYASKKNYMEILCSELRKKNIPFEVEQTRTLIFLKGWKINAKITTTWTLSEFQEKTRDMFILSRQTDTALEGCGAYMPKN